MRKVPPAGRNGRDSSAPETTIDRFRAQHLALAETVVETPDGPQRVQSDEGESPLLWLARRRDRAGAPLITPVQLQAGERLRAEFTRANLTPRVTTDWTAAMGARGGAAPGVQNFTDAVLAARERVNAAMRAVGPEFAGLLLDICCFLKRLEDVERERKWPSRSAKIVLQLGLDRLARHYGLQSEATGRPRATIRAWQSEAPSGSECGNEGAPGFGLDAIDH